MAARGARAAARAHAAHRRAHADIAADDPEAQARIAAFRQGLQRAGLDRRPQRADRLPLGAGDADAASASTRRNWSRSRRTSSLASRHRSRGRCCKATTARCRSCSSTSPIRSAPASSRAWRGRAATSPASPSSSTSMSGKWLELLKEIAPRVTRAGGPARSAAAAGLASSARHPGGRAVARGGAELRSTCATPARSSAPFDAFARAPNGGLIVHRTRIRRSLIAI